MAHVTQECPRSVSGSEDSVVINSIEVANRGDMCSRETHVIPVEQKTAQRRGTYVSNACMNCQARKIKCSGEPRCNQCQSFNLVCEYRQGPRTRRTKNGRRKEAEPGNLVRTSSNEQPHHKTLMQLVERIAELERNYLSLQNDIRAESDKASIDSLSGSRCGDSSPQSDLTFATIPDNEVFRGRGSLIEQIGLLDRSMASETAVPSDSRLDSRDATFAPVTWSELPRRSEKAVETLEKETRHNNLLSIRAAVDVFFAHLNPHYPCISENMFRPLFEKFLNNEELKNLNYADRQQFVALLNLIQAEVRMLSDEWPTSTRAPAWEEFCRAETILNHLTWLGSGNVMTIQCLVIKARYLLYAEKASGAYDTMGRAVRLCWQLGLHDQPSWKGLTPFETIMRQRIFWTVFYLERNIALYAGAPYLIRQTDFKVDLPPNLEDRLLFPEQLLPPQLGPEESAANSYLAAASRWGRLMSEIWDALYGVNAQKPPSAEFIATMDARIQFTGSLIPQELQWDRNVHRLNGSTTTPRYVIRQTAILYQRMNQLRLLLRQERMLTLSCDDEMARDSVSIASASIKAVYDSLHSPTQILVDRFSSCLYLSSSLLPLICIIINDASDPFTRGQAIEAYNQALSMLQSMAPSFSAARHTLRCLDRIIQTTERAIQRFHHAEQFPPDTDEMDPETLMLQMTDFFDRDRQSDWEMDLFNGSLDGPFNFGATERMDVNFLGL